MSKKWRISELDRAQRETDFPLASHSRLFPLPYRTLSMELVLSLMMEEWARRSKIWRVDEFE